MSDRRISTLSELKPGDHIKYEFGLKQKVKKSLGAMHHALVIKVLNECQLCVIHNNGLSVVEEVKFYDPVDITVITYSCRYSPEEAIQRARERIGAGYNVLKDNCEHLVTWAKTGKAVSKQVQKGTGAGIAAGAITGGAVGSVIPVVGTVAGAIVGGTLGLFGGLYAYTSKSKLKSS